MEVNQHDQHHHQKYPRLLAKNQRNQGQGGERGGGGEGEV